MLLGVISMFFFLVLRTFGEKNCKRAKQEIDLLRCSVRCRGEAEGPNCISGSYATAKCYAAV